MRVYIAGPYTQGDIVMNTRKAILMGDKIAQMGFYPFIPHLTHFWHFLCPGDYEYWMKQDLEWLLLCDCVFRLPGESKGADRECAIAKQQAIPVFTELHDLVRYDRAMSNWISDGGLCDKGN